MRKAPLRSSGIELALALGLLACTNSHDLDQRAVGGLVGAGAGAAIGAAADGGTGAAIGAASGGTLGIAGAATTPPPHRDIDGAGQTFCSNRGAFLRRPRLEILSEVKPCRAGTTSATAAAMHNSGRGRDRTRGQGPV